MRSDTRKRIHCNVEREEEEEEEEEEKEEKKEEEEEEEVVEEEEKNYCWNNKSKQVQRDTLTYPHEADTVRFQQPLLDGFKLSLFRDDGSFLVILVRQIHVHLSDGLDALEGHIR